MPNASIGVSAGPLRVSQGLSLGGGLIAGLIAAPGLIGLIVVCVIIGFIVDPEVTSISEPGEHYSRTLNSQQRETLRPGLWRANSITCQAIVDDEDLVTSKGTFRISKGDSVTTTSGCTWEWVAE